MAKAGRPLKAKELSRVLNVSAQDYNGFRDHLKALAASGELYKVKGARYAPPEKINLVTGTISVNRRGAGFVSPERGGDDVYVPAGELGTACHGDRVVVRLAGRRRGRVEASVVRVLDRARNSFVGTAKLTGKFFLVHPDDPRFFRDIFVPLEDAQAEDGDKVVVEISDWGSHTSAPTGTIVENLGKVGDPGQDVLILVRNSGIETEFPRAVEAAADKIPEKIPPKEVKRRVDLRDREVVTIDPPTAKDFDDALSIQSLQDGNFELGIHIADVSHYVRQDDPIDREAQRRGTSVYLVDRVIPMLPEVLSNGVCSLNPHVDRLAQSVLATVTPRGRVVSYRVEDTVIRSSERLAYEEVQAYFDGGPVDEKVESVKSSLDSLRSLALVLNGKRQRRGALDFDLPTSRVLLDEKGYPVDIQKVVRVEANRLVEEFMLLANELIAKTIKQARIPGVYRVHEEPKEEKLDDLVTQIGPFGYTIYEDGDGTTPPKELQRILQQAQGQPEEYVVHSLVLRSLMRARYDIFPLGHYGLALKDYTHFTSPIRRYPDLLVHRILRVLRGVYKRPFSGESRWREWLEDAAVHSSERERAAEGLERDSIELKKIQFMERHVGDVFEGIVSGVETFGFFVELLDYHVSGLVHINNLADDYYEYREEEFSLVGSTSGRKFSLGDRLQVQVMAVKKELRQIDFTLVGEPEVRENESRGKRMKRAESDFQGRKKRKAGKPSSRTVKGRKSPPRRKGRR